MREERGVKGGGREKGDRSGGLREGGRKDETFDSNVRYTM